MPEHEQPEDQDQVQRSHIPNLEVFLQELYTERLSPEQLQAQALGLHQDDFMALVSPLEAPTTPIDPTNVFALGFGTEIGLAWQFQRPVGGRLVSMEVQRATVAAMTDAVSLGEYTGFFMVDDNKRAKWAASTTRYYQVRAVARSGETNYFSPWTPAVPVSGTTLAAGSSNSDLQTRMDTFAQAVQLRHLYAGVGDTSALSQAVSVLSQQVSILSQKVSVLSSLPAASVTSQEMSVADAALSARIDTQSQSVSVLSQAISVISQQVSALSQRLSGLSVIAGDLAISGSLSVGGTISVDRVRGKGTSALRLGTNALDRWVLDGTTGGFIAQVGTGYDFGSNAGPIKDLYVYGVLNFLNSATGATETTLAWTLSALRVSAASVFFTGDVKISGNLSAPILDTLSNAISILSQQVSVLSQSVSSQAAALSVRIDTQSQSISVLSQAVSVISQQISALSQSVSSQAAALSVRIDTQSQAISVISQQVSVLSQAVSVLSQGLSVVSNAASNALSVANAASNAASVVSQAVSVLSQAVSVAQAALSVRIDTQSQSVSVLSQQVSILSLRIYSSQLTALVSVSGLISADNRISNAASVVSQAVSVLSQATSVAQAALSVRIDTQSQSISVLSQQTSVLSQGISVVSQALSVQAAALSVRIDTQSQSISVISQQVSELSQRLSGLSIIAGNLNISGVLSIRGGQIGFPAVQLSSTGANVLDDYEEGSWTPVPTNLTVVGTPTYTGFYTKIGRFVHLTLLVESTVTTASTAGSTTWAGLPFSIVVDGLIMAVDANNQTSYGNGLMAAANGLIYSPTWAATARVALNAVYMGT